MDNKEFRIGSNPTLFLFLNAECPICQKYQGQLAYYRDSFNTFFVFPSKQESQLISEYIAVDSIPPSSVVLDPECILSSELKAVVTPQAILISEGKMVYSGLIDDRFAELGASKPRASVNYIRKALNSLRNHEALEIPSTKAVGCFIEP